MRALVLRGEARLEHNHPAPERRPGEARIRVRQAGICDTDLQLVRGYMGFEGVLGHEFVGDVLESDTPSLVGRRVVADINAGCGRCEECTHRLGHHCAERTVLGILGRDGALAEELCLPERTLCAVPDTVDDDGAVFAEPLAAALHATDAFDAEDDATVAVLGDGKLGLLTALAFASLGARVVCVGHHAHKLAIAAQAGVTARLESELDPAGRFACVVEATGSARGMRRALEMTRARGTVILKTTVAGAAAIDWSPVVINELRIEGSRCGSIARAIRAIETGSVDPRALISARFPLDDAVAALGRAGERGVLKVLVRP